MSERIEKCESPDSPDRCQGISAQGQCNNKAYPGTRFCLIHNRAAPRIEETKRINNYNLAKWQAKLESKVASPDIKCLRDEVGVLRILLEERLNLCNDATDLLLHSGPLSELVMKIERVVVSCDKLETRMGQLLDKTAILQFAQTVIGIMADEIEDQSVLDIIATKIVEAVGNTAAPKNESN